MLRTLIFVCAAVTVISAAPELLEGRVVGGVDATSGQFPHQIHCHCHPYLWWLYYLTRLYSNGGPCVCVVSRNSRKMVRSSNYFNYI
ncbi:uncharacterized protein LOC122322876 [Drosophila grimshawi]|uniref:uncharacterized protein LOC122322876 n=1 Tax=Drosophila grimshawi TaxID=7222 RepID=UPI001C933022|nr:uncharacterized protein LOC122322876 [Drosophila grimshawi]